MENQCSTACGLGPAELQARLNDIAQLNWVALRRIHRDGSHLTLFYDPAARPIVMQLISQEEECCAFLNISVEETSTMMIVAIDGPNEASFPLLDAFSVQAPEPKPKPSCGCCAEMRI